ncbi:MAG TPA: aminopeptidase P family N-terminal domain-containing protein, partial [Gaiellaceae bacterium]|nr:aminopeptidase P family N-terminal domain-containing protein [Gaiellaceae bacterium]
MSAALAHLPPMDVAARTERLRGRFEQAGIDALLVTRLPNVVYLTGFSGSAAMVLVGPDELVFVTDGRYAEQAGEQLATAGVEARLEVRVSQTGQRDVMRESAGGYRRLGLEAHGVTWSQQRTFAGEWFPDAELVATEGLVEALRKVKDAGEVERMAAAATIADEALARVL